MSLSEYLHRVVALVETHGWMVQGVMGSNEMPSFSYTVGLHSSYGHPEILLFGLNVQTAQQILNDVGGRVREGEVFTHGQQDAKLFAGFPALFGEVPAHEAERWLRVAHALAEGPVPTLQAVWPDPQGRFPWESGFDVQFAEAQPVLFVPPALRP